MKEKYKILFEKAASRTSDEELLRAVLDSGKAEENMSDNKQKRAGRAMLVPIIAAAAVAATSMGAAAVYSRSAKDDFEKVLVPDEGMYYKYEDKDGNAADLRDKTLDAEGYEQLGGEFGKSFDCGDFTLEFTDTINDGNIVYVKYSVRFKKEPDWEFGDNLLNIDSICQNGVHSLGTLSEGVFEKQDGKTVYSSYLSYCVDDGITGPLEVRLFEMFSPSLSVNYDLDIDLEIPINDNSGKMSKTVDISGAPRVELEEWGNWNLDKTEFTPLSMTFEMSTVGVTPDPTVCKFYNPGIPVSVTFKDGSTLGFKYGKVLNIDPESKTFAAQYLFTYPINVEDIATVQFANTVFDMDGNVVRS